MKRKIYIASLLAVTFSFTACDKGFDKENTDPINIISTSPDKLLSPAIINVVGGNLIRNRNFNNELMQVTVTQSDDDNAVFRYDYRPSYADYTWNIWYPQLTNFRDIYDLASKPEYKNDSYKGIALVCEAWVFSLLTDTYGDVPFKEANAGKSGNVEPVFDPQKDIYLALLAKLEEANTLLTANVAIQTDSDPLYNGNIALWRKFSNSLHLRLLLRLSGKLEVKTSMIAKIKEIVDTNPSKYPIFNDNSEAAVLMWNGTTTTTSPYTNPYVNGLREADFTIPSLCNFFILKLDAWNDPRIDISTKYGVSSRNRMGIAPGGSGFTGIDSGYEPGTRDLRQAYFYSFSNSEFSLQKNPLTGVIMTYAELQYILAEAAAKGWISGSAQTYFYKGMASGINYWVPNFSTDINGQEFTDYITNAGLTWDNSLPLDAATGESKMERIHVQKYYSMFLADFQQWFEYRRTGHPILPIGPGVRNGGKMPARMNYPVYLKSANSTNYNNAVSRMGGDSMNTLVWWQKP